MKCKTNGCDNPTYEGFKYCETCLTIDPVPPSVTVEPLIYEEGTLDHFNRFVAGDR